MSVTVKDAIVYPNLGQCLKVAAGSFGSDGMDSEECVVPDLEG